MDLRISQNFVHSQKLAKHIIDLAHFSQNDRVIEIGPGKGIFTREIGLRVTNLIIVEKDKFLVEQLKETFTDQTNIQVAGMDFLDFTLPNYDDYKIFGNIPFNLTSKIIQKLLTTRNPPKKAILIMQREAFERYIGNNLISLQYSPWFSFKNVHSFQRGDFTPVPAVESVLCRIEKRQNPEIDAKNKMEYLNFISFAFRFGNPNLQNSLKKLFTDRQVDFIRKTLKKDIRQSPSLFNFADWLVIFDSFTNYVDKEKKMLVNGSFESLSREQNKISKVYRTRRPVNY